MDTSRENGLILIIDDNAVNISVASKCLKDAGYTTVMARNGNMGIKRAEFSQPDLILLDVMMPGISGFETCNLLKSNAATKDIPVIFMTALNDVENKIKGFDAGGVDYISKPIEQREVIARVQTHLALRNLQKNLEKRVAERTAELEALNAALNRFVPHKYLEFLNKKSIIDVSLGDHVAKEMAVMFSDIRSFTSLSESMTPQENFDFVNAYLKRVSPEIRKYNGIIVKFLGDGFMAVFPNGASDALKAGIANHKKVATYNLERIQDGYDSIKIGVGIHTGHMMMGVVGEEHRIQGDMLSDSVNLAARLEGLTKFYGAGLIISEDVLQRVTAASENQATAFQTRFLDRVVVRGRHEPINIYEVLEGLSGTEYQLKMQTLSLFEAGMEAYLTQDFQNSQRIFEQVLAVNPHDKAAHSLAQRVKHFIINGVPADWDGVTWMTEK